ncbi:hypothetical protein PHYBLDRAFT_150992 [Phycomyces blakesleeanus NRRL 1555(-)]|uniref:Uncharacterized protein n=1 Tax=Phycomyces blakesleeanus (strain ATCC 8743b / DSM 1359 / FGSC 10004 / NBRC 33097 / NRRL 1555) TaxID=763407 RepID=A0A167KEF0_PHYB8|nr:hypothetical protein PHYBLDRAFT_150992 [Phycomyces blakesleeanus NRRL 1555(-)]OAD67906.1 hypothetical protein PHYBLDRAFT_150992 [Phycomyces blakesleeanus NRRL 1555(-)]|eukprot:XP_018285946.1 hypothetical protein PHYBLDRAFT_150992 [Phycomyces blakesleeanus NRRL 1555(-)]
MSNTTSSVKYWTRSMEKANIELHRDPKTFKTSVLITELYTTKTRNTCVEFVQPFPNTD